MLRRAEMMANSIEGSIPEFDVRRSPAIEAKAQRTTMDPDEQFLNQQANTTFNSPT
jgi:hypothetical protein